MTRLLFIRHGQSVANKDKIFAGHYNVELSKLGKRQAQATAEFVVKNYNVDAVYASDLIRAYETGKAVADKLDLEVIPESRMTEKPLLLQLTQLPSELWNKEFQEDRCHI